MKTRIKVLVGQGGKALMAAAGLGLGIFWFSTRSLPHEGLLPTRQLLLSTLVFLLTFVALRLFAHVTACHLNREVASLDGAPVSPRAVWVFIVYKELVKCAVGVSLTLAWIAGLLYVSCNFVSPLAMAALGSFYSLLLYAITYGFVLFVDQIPYPFGR